MTYRFISRSYNNKGHSPYSSYGYIAFGDVPATLSSPTIVSSTETSIKMAWTAPLYSNLTIKGYILNMDDGTDTIPVPVYYGATRPDILTY
jgi:hypothetical protein